MTTETFQNDQLVIRVTHMDRSVDVTWEGTSDSRDPETFLGPILKKVALDSKNKAVTVDLSQIRYMNSATVAPMIEFMKEMSAHQVETLILWNKQVGWQRFNFLCMQTIARTLPNVTVEAR